jgi:Ca-activated chloride channel family protein
VAQLPETIRVGIVAFASEPETLVAPTTDREAIEDALESLTAKNGTAMGDALMLTLDLAEQIQKDDEDAPTASAAPDAGASPDPSAAPDASTAPDASAAPDAPVDTPSGEPLVAAILLSDGANSVGETEPLDAAERAASLGVPIYTIALGTPDGEVEVRDDLGQVHTLQVPPDTETLAQIAEVTGAAAFDAPTAEDLSAVYANLESRIGHVEERQEITSWFAAAALALVVVGAGLSALWFGRLP